MSIELQCPNSECGKLLQFDSAPISNGERCPHCDITLSELPENVESQPDALGVMSASDSRNKATIAATSPTDDDAPSGNAPTILDVRDRSTLEAGMPSNPMPAVDSHPYDFDKLSQYLNAKRTGELEPFIVEKMLAKGGMGEVLIGHDAAIHRQVAVKVIKPPYASSVEHRSRFLEEAQITGQLEHPNIVPIHDLSLDANGDLYFSMKLVRGESLSDILKATKDGKESSRSLAQLLNIFLKACDGIAFAHSRGVVHRDLKPANIMVGDFGEVLVMDWGLAKSIGTNLVPFVTTTSAEDGETSATTFIESDSLREGVRATARTEETEAGTVQGTPAYMPPEQARGDIDLIDHRADIYSLGAILYRVLTLERPVEGKGVVAILKNVQQGNVTPPEERAPQRGIPRELSAVVMKAMQTRREDRYQSVTDLALDVTLFLEGRAVSAKADTAVESFVKLVRRNKALSTAIGIAASIILVLATVSYVRITVERDRAVKGEQLAQANALAAQQSEQKTTAAQKKQWKTALAASKRFAMQAVEQAELHQLEPAKRRAAEAKLVAPAGPWALFAQGEIAMARADYPQAAQLFQLAAENPDGNQPEIRAALAEALAQQGTLQNAEALLTKLDEIDDWRIVLGAGRTLYAAHKWDACQQPLARAIELMNKERDRPKENLVEAEQLLDAAPAQKACEGFYEAIQTLPLEELRERLSEKMAELHGEKYYYRIEGDLKQGLVLQAGKQRALKYLYPFRKLPFVEADISVSAVWDLSPFEEMSLTRLNCRACTFLRDINVLSGMKSLVDLDLAGTGVADLSPLTGLKLRQLDCHESRRIDDLSPLIGMPLQFIDLEQTNVADLTPLKDMPLTKLIVGRQVRDLSPVRGMQLTYFEKLYDVTSLEPLRGMRLETFKLRFGNPVGDHLDDDFFSPLAGMPLKHVNLEGTEVSDVSALQGAPLEHLDIRLCRHIKSLEPLRDSPVSTLNLWGAWIKDPSPLESLKNIDERRCPWVPYLLGKMSDEELGERLRKLRQRGLLTLNGNNPPDEIPRFVQEFKVQKLYGQGKRKEALDVVNGLIDKWGATTDRMEWKKWLTRELAKQQQGKDE